MKNKAFTLLELMIVLVIGGLLAVMLVGGIGGCAFGTGQAPGAPETTVEITITSKHVDVQKDGDGGSSSHYMVVTNKGVFEVQNGLFLGVWNADEIYGKLEPGKTYDVVSRGNKVVNMFMQEYPYIIRVVNGPK